MARSVRLKPQQPTQVFFKRSINNGESFGNEVQVSQSTQDSLGAVVTANGLDVYIAWSDVLPSGEIFLVHSGDSGATFGATKNVSTSSGDSRNPRLATASSTEIHATWLDHTPGNWDVFFARGTLP